MSIKSNFRKVTELGIGLTAIATLVLAGCGGGGGGGTTAGGTPITLTPVKGKFSGTCNFAIATTANPNTPIATSAQTIAANGTVSLAVPAGATGPFVISVLGDASGNCRFFNDVVAAPANVPFLAGQTMNALVPSNQVTANAILAVTALTEMAFQAASAVNGGNVNNLTDSSPAINNGIVAAMNLAGLPASAVVANFFQPPPVIPASGVPLPTDPLGAALVTIAQQNPANPLAAVNANAITAAATVLQANPASAAQATALNNQANTLAGTFVPAAGAQSFATVILANRAQAASAVANAAVTSQLVADFTSAKGLRTLAAGWTVPTLGVSIPAMAGVLRATLTNGVLSLTATMSKLLNGAWTAATSSGQYVLAANGWIDRNFALRSMTINPNGTAHVIEEGYGTHDLAVSAVSMSGMSIASGVAMTTIAGPYGTSINPAGVLGANAQVILDQTLAPSAANAPVTGNFTAGAVAYTRASANGAVASQDIYEVNDYPLIDQATGIDTNSVYALSQTLTPLTTLPASNQSFCYGGYGLAPAAVQPVQGLTTYAVTNVNGGGLAPTPCGTQGAVAMGVWGSVTLTPAVVNGQTVLLVGGLGATPPNSPLNYTGAMTPIFKANSFLAVVNGAVHVGTLTPAGQPFPNVKYPVFVNDAAAQQFSAAAGTRLPAF